MINTYINDTPIPFYRFLGVPRQGKSDAQGMSGLGMESGDGRHYQFRQITYRTHRDGGWDVVQPGDSESPEMIWRPRTRGQEHTVSLTIINTTGAPIPIKRIVLWQEIIPLPAGGKPLAFFQPGWQTWSQAGTAFPPIQEPAPVKAVRLPKSRNPQYTFPSVTGIEQGSDARVWGFITAIDQTGMIEFDPLAHCLEASVYADNALLLPGETLTTDELLITCAPNLQQALARYAVLLGERMGAAADPTRELWWCTWYERLAKIDAAFVFDNLAWIERHRELLPIAGILIDQGHEMHMGDWLDTDQAKFPGGLKPVINAVHAAGLQFGLWLAPLFFSERSLLYRDHPNWAVQDESGAPLVAKVLEGIEHYSLDTTNPNACAWLAGMIEDAIALGVDLFKFDYLYAGAIAGKRSSPSVTSVQAYRRGMAVINAVLSRHPSVRVLGCGAPFTASVGLFSLMRTATDTVPYWPQPGDERFNLDGTQSGQRLTLQSLAARSWMKDALWSPDSDAFILRAHDNQLTLPEIYTQAILYWLNERFMTIGDNMTKLEDERLAIYSWLYPALGPWVQALASDEDHQPNAFLYEPDGCQGKLVALVNWADEARSVAGFNAERDVHVVDTLTGEYLGQLKEGEALTRRLQPHSTQIMRLTTVAAHPQVIGANLHIAGGMAEIQAETWDETERSLTIVFQSEGSHQGNVLIYIPEDFEPQSAEEEIKNGVLVCPLRLVHQQVFRQTYRF